MVITTTQYVCVLGNGLTAVNPYMVKRSIGIRTTPLTKFCVRYWKNCENQ